MIYLGNAFSLSMLDGNARIDVECVHRLAVRSILDEHTRWQSCVGHQNTAEIFAKELGVDVPCQRITVSLSQRDVLIVGQYVGPRLEEGATELPDGARIDWRIVTVL